MKSIKVLVLIVLLWQFSYAAEEISQAKAAELSLHRMERLVTLENIDKSFVKDFRALKVAVLEKKDPADPRFYILAEQYAAEDGTKNELELWFNPDAPDRRKQWPPFNVKSGGSATGAPQWPVEEKDAVTLAENASHYILDNWQTKEELKLYNEKLVSLSLTQVVRETGEIIAQVDFEVSDKDAPILRVFIKAQDGGFDSAVLVPKPTQPDQPVEPPPADNPVQPPPPEKPTESGG